MSSTALLPSTHLRYRITSTPNDRVTVAEVSIVPGHGEPLATGIGAAMRIPEDDVDPAVGLSLSLGRALCDLGQQLKRAGWRAVQENDQARGGINTRGLIKELRHLGTKSAIETADALEKQSAATNAMTELATAVLKMEAQE